MSISICLSADNYTLIACDTRATFLEEHDGKKYRDGEQKLFLTQFGWAAQSGGVSVTPKLFKEYLDTHDIKNRNHIWICFLWAIRETEKYINSKLSCTTCYKYQLDYFKDNILHMEINTIDFIYKTRQLIAHNSLVVSPPKKTKRINILTEQYTQLIKGSVDINESIFLIASLMDRISKLTKLIDNNINCGISIKISDSEVLYLRLAEDCKTVIKQYKLTKDLSSLMNVIKLKDFRGIENVKI